MASKATITRPMEGVEQSETKTLWRCNFDSLDISLEYLANSKPHPSWLKEDGTPISGSAQGKRASESAVKFTGTGCIEEADRLAKFGWPEGRENMARTMVEANAIMKYQRAPGQEHGPAGMFPDVPAYIAGDPDCMITFAPNEAARAPVVDFLVNISASSAVSPKAITARGAAILAWIDAIEAAGERRIALSVVENVTSNRRRQCITTQIKRPDEPLDIDRVSYVLSHPSYLRRHIFEFNERGPWGDFFAGGYGHPEDIPEQEIPTNTVYFGSLTGDVSLSEAVQRAQDLIARAGILDPETLTQEQDHE